MAERLVLISGGNSPCMVDLARSSSSFGDGVTVLRVTPD